MPRGELLTDRRNRFYGSYLAKVKQKMKIEVNREALQRVRTAKRRITLARRGKRGKEKRKCRFSSRRNRA